MKKIKITLLRFMILGVAIVSLAQTSTAETPETQTIQTVSIEDGPSLTAVATPSFSSFSNEPSNLWVDKKFPMFLEAEGNFNGAILEWYRLMHQSMDASIKESALFEIALLYKRSKQYEKALETAETFLGHYPKSEKRARILYLKSTVLDILQQGDAGIKTRMELLQTIPDNAWLEEAELHNIWSIAVTGDDNFPAAVTTRGIALQEKLKNYPVHYKNEKVTLITLSAFIPGLGHLMLGEYKKALALALLNILAFLAFFSAMRHMQWSYSMLFGLIAGFVYLGNLYSATLNAQNAALNDRLNAMSEWHKLQPMDPIADPLITNKINVNADLIGTRKPWQTY